MSTVVPMGILFSDSLLHSEVVAVLAAFVAINTIGYVTLAVAKMLPKVYVRDWIGTRNRRAETRSIDPAAPVGGPQSSNPRAHTSR